MKINNQIIKDLKLEKCTYKDLTAFYNFMELNAGILKKDITKNKNSRYLKNKKFDFGVGTIEYKENDIIFSSIVNNTEKDYVFFDISLLEKYRSHSILALLKISAWCFKNSKEPFIFRVNTKEEKCFFGTNTHSIISKSIEDLKKMGITVEKTKPYKKTFFELKVWNKQKTQKHIEPVFIGNNWIDEMLDESEKSASNPNNLRNKWEYEE